MSFVAWRDARGFAFGTRVGADGAPLDPLGITIPDVDVPERVIWTGDDFAVIGQTATGRAVVFVRTDGSLSPSKPLDVPTQYNLVAVSSTGSNARLLFVRYDSNETLDARIVSARGDLVATVVAPLSSPLAAPPHGTRFIGAGRRNDFAVFGPSASVLIDRDGRVIANQAVFWPFDYFFTENISVAGIDGQGFVLLRQDASYYSDAIVRACQLDDHAAYTGKTALLDLPWMWRLAQDRPAIAAAGDAYIVVNRGLYGDNSVHEYLTHLSFALVAGTVEVPDGGVPLVLTTDSIPAMMVTSRGLAVYLQTVSQVVASDPVLLNLSPPTQSNVAIAASSAGYAVAWVEQQPDGLFETYVRRFRMTGEPLDEAAMAVGPPAQYPPPPTLTATADVYVVNGRRLLASDGQWIDSASPGSVIASASNGHTALIALQTWSGPTSGTTLQEIPAPGSTPSQGVPLPRSAMGPVTIGYEAAFRINLASNGTDYIVVWNEYFSCPFECPPIPTHVYALRVRADGTWIDPSPIQLSPNGSRPSVAWAGGSYVVTWTGSDGIHATRITTDGTILDGTGDGVIVQSRNPQYEDIASIVVSLGSDALLLIHHRPWIGDSSWDGVRFAPNDLAAAVNSPRATLPSTGSAAAVGGAGGVVLAYDKSYGASSGYVSRVYTQFFGDPIPRRRAIAH